LIEKLEEAPKERREAILKVYGELKRGSRRVFTIALALASLFTATTPLIKTFLQKVIIFMLCVMAEVSLGRELLNIEKSLDELRNIISWDNIDKHAKSALKRVSPLFIYVALCSFLTGIAILMGW